MTTLVLLACLAGVRPSRRSAAALDNFEPYYAEAALKIEYCTIAIDCQRFGDIGATCGTNRQCECSAGYTGKSCHTEAAATSDIYEFTFVLGFPNADCDKLTRNDHLTPFNNLMQYETLHSDVICEPSSMAWHTRSIPPGQLHEVAVEFLVAAHELGATDAHAGDLGHSITSPVPRLVVSAAPTAVSPKPTCAVTKASRVVVIDSVCRPLQCSAGFERYRREVHGSGEYSCGVFTEELDKGMTSLMIAGSIVGFVTIVFFVLLICVRFACKRRTSLDDRRDAAKDFQANFTPKQVELINDSPVHYHEPLPSSPTGYPYGATPLPPVTRERYAEPNPSRGFSTQFVETEHGGEPINGTHDDGEMREATTFQECEV